MMHRSKRWRPFGCGVRFRLARRWIRDGGAACMGWLCCLPLLMAGDWPQILGPQRNGRASQERVRRDWGDEQPRVRWDYQVGEGLAGVAVVEGRVVLFHRRDDREIVEALQVDSGEQQWMHDWRTRYVSSISPDAGPRCVPVVHTDAVYLYGAEGRLVCVGLDDGKERWAVDTRRKFGAPEGYFGAGSTPIVIDQKLLVNVGGDGAGVVAFDLQTGETLWAATDDRASYAAPASTNFGEREYALFVTRLHFVALDAETGQERFRLPFGRRGPTVNGATPLVLGEHVFLSASYGVGAQLVSIAADDAEVAWSRDDLMSSQYTTCVEHASFLYGVDGREDVGVARLRCIDPRQAEVRWTSEEFGMATLILAGETLVVMKTDGQLVLVDASPEAYRELARFELFDDTTRALPALAHGQLYVRDTKLLKCIDLRPGR